MLLALSYVVGGILIAAVGGGMIWFAIDSINFTIRIHRWAAADWRAFLRLLLGAMLVLCGLLMFASSGIL